MTLKFIIAYLFFLSNVHGQIISRIESVQSLYIEVYHDNQFLGKATGFAIKSKSQNYLITNWHVVTNKKPSNQEWIDPLKKISPNKIVIAQHSKSLGTFTARTEVLVDKDGHDKFIEFKIGNEMLDVVALPLKDTAGNISFYPVNYLLEIDPSILISPTDRVFILGFPKGQTSSQSFFPIWKSGLIASEPDIDQEGKPIIWVDVDAYPGMSGCPVYLIGSQFTSKDGGINNYSPPISLFMGVFNHKVGEEINIGALWKASYLRKIFKSLP